MKDKKYLAFVVAAVTASTFLLQACEDNPQVEKTNCVGQGCTEQSSETQQNKQPDSGLTQETKTPSKEAGSDSAKATKDGTATDDQVVHSTQGNTLSFDLPASWKIDSEVPDRAALNQTTKDNVKPYVILEVGVAKDGGTEADAKKMAQDHYQQDLKGYGGEADFTPKYAEKLFDGKKIFVAETTGNYWGKPSWYSSAFFEKGGKIFTFELDDLLENQEAAVKKVIETVTAK